MDVAAFRMDEQAGGRDHGGALSRPSAPIPSIWPPPCTAEDQCVQSMPDASPAKWHRAHTTWFFEQFVLRTFAPDYRVFDRVFGFLFNSYYEAVGARHPRPMRGLLTRPSNRARGARIVRMSMLRWRG